MAKLSDKGGDLVGALTVTEGDEVLVVMEKGKIVRSRVDEVRPTGRDTSGVRFAAPDPGDAIIAVARNPERALADRDADLDADLDADEDTEDIEGGVDGEGAVQAGSAERSEGASGLVDGVPSSVEHATDSDESDEPGDPGEPERADGTEQPDGEGD